MPETFRVKYKDIYSPWFTVPDQSHNGLNYNELVGEVTKRIMEKMDRNHKLDNPRNVRYDD